MVEGAINVPDVSVSVITKTGPNAVAECEMDALLLGRTRVSCCFCISFVFVFCASLN